MTKRDQIKILDDKIGSNEAQFILDRKKRRNIRSNQAVN